MPSPVAARRTLKMLSKPLIIVGLIACFAVAAVLAVGIGGFAKGGEFNAKYANKLMQLRLLMQFIAVVIIVGMAYFFGRTG